MTIAKEARDYLYIGVSHEGIAGDVMRHYALTPRFDALLLEEIALQFPEDRTGKTLVLFENEARACFRR